MNKGTQGHFCYELKLDTNPIHTSLGRLPVFTHELHKSALKIIGYYTVYVKDKKLMSILPNQCSELDLGVRI